MQAKAAILFDWDNWWAVEFSSGPSVDLKYVPHVEKYYKAFHNRNIAVDLINPHADFSKYDIVVAPVLYMVKPGVAGRIEAFVNNGGIFVTTFFSGLVDENDLVTPGGYPGELRKVLGIWAEEIDALHPEMKNSMIIKTSTPGLNTEYTCGLLCDLIHLEGAKALAVYGKDFYAGMPVLTENEFGKEKAYYIASDPEQKFLDDFVKCLCDSKNIKAPIEVMSNVDVTQRFKDGKAFIFVLNHNDFTVKIDLKDFHYFDLLKSQKKQGLLELEPNGVAILECQVV